MTEQIISNRTKLNKNKTYQKRYDQSEKGKAAKKRYTQSEKCKAAEKRRRQTNKRKVSKRHYEQSEKGKAALKRYRQSEKGKAALKRYEQTDKGRKNRSNQTKQFYIRHPDQSKARTAVNYAIRDGKLPRPDSLQCHYCPARAEQYHHHKGYAQEHWLDVIPACIKCHSSSREK